MKNFEARSKEYRNYIEQYLSEWYARFSDEPQKQLFEAMQYSLLAGGKRIGADQSVFSRLRRLVDMLLVVEDLCATLRAQHTGQHTRSGQALVYGAFHLLHA